MDNILMYPTDEPILSMEEIDNAIDSFFVRDTNTIAIDGLEVETTLDTSPADKAFV